MPNMSYCMFENTSNDMQQCVNAMEEFAEENMGVFNFDKFKETLDDSYEARSFDKFLELCQQVVSEFLPDNDC